MSTAHTVGVMGSGPPSAQNPRGMRGHVVPVTVYRHEDRANASRPSRTFASLKHCQITHLHQKQAVNREDSASATTAEEGHSTQRSPPLTSGEQDSSRPATAEEGLKTALLQHRRSERAVPRRLRPREHTHQEDGPPLTPGEQESSSSETAHEGGYSTWRKPPP